eukprot:COSAG03_NODE_6175_length_1102_cov_1.680957_1_plen_174_part_10
MNLSTGTAVCMASLLRAVWLLSWAAAQLAASPPPPRVVHMRADGSDRHTGASNRTAVRTLTRVHELVRGLILANRAGPIEVQIAPGRYFSRHWYDYRAKWPANDTMPTTITFMPAPVSREAAGGDGAAPWPVVFDGCAGPAGPCAGGTFFDLVVAEPTHSDRERDRESGRESDR